MRGKKKLGKKNIKKVEKYQLSVISYQLSVIIRITVFPLDDKFVFGDILFFLADILQLFAEWAKWAKLEGGGRGGAEKIARAEGP